MTVKTRIKVFISITKPAKETRAEEQVTTEDLQGKHLQFWHTAPNLERERWHCLAPQQEQEKAQKEPSLS